MRQTMEASEDDRFQIEAELGDGKGRSVVLTTAI